MAHDVSFSVPDRPVGLANIVFVVKKNGAKFGELKISKGALVWQPAYKVNTYKLDWSKFAKLVEEEGQKGPYG